MRIGIDLDGVVFDSESTIRTYAEIFAIEDVNGSPIADITEPKNYKRYNWTKEQNDAFVAKYILKAIKESDFMGGFIPVYRRLRALGCEFVVITARGGFYPEMIDMTMKALKENNIEMDAYHFVVKDKLKICNEEKVDLMIDDDHDIIEAVTKGGIPALYFRPANMKKLDDNELVTEVNNWGDVYRKVLEIMGE